MTANTTGTNDGDWRPAATNAEVESGTGWPDEDDDAPALHAYRPNNGESGAAAPARTAVASHDHHTVALPEQRGNGSDAGEPRRRRRWIPFAATGRKAFWLAMTAGVIVILFLLTGLFGLWPKLGNPFSSQRTDRTGPVLLVSIQDLSRFEAASGNFQVIVDLQNDRRFIPDFLFNQRSLFVADGSVDAYVDFSNIGQGDIKVDPTDAKKVTISLPAPQLEPPNLDLNRSYLYATQKGLINKLGDIFSDNSNSEEQLYQLGQQKIAAAALDSQLPQRAEQNTRAMLTEMLHSLGYTTVTVNFASA